MLTMGQSGCDEETFRSRCPALKRYSGDFQKKAAEELAKAGVRVNQLVTDYGQLRDACRALENAK
jgi:hypothetical protein